MDTLVWNTGDPCRKIVKGEDVVRIMEAPWVPVRIQTDNGSEFISKV
ncbi:hypothetical protein KCP76_12880 [Salmonella enterica subsp. enterica serovar Weltevreden]|nr:hypothetical protein KCP76_12880 [Salmonella enterica subsp. enterica serovar Weltevreden]